MPAGVCIGWEPPPSRFAAQSQIVTEFRSLVARLPVAGFPARQEQPPPSTNNPLASEARFYDLIDPRLHPAYGEKFSVLNQRWRSNHWFASERQLWDYLLSVKADFNQRGDRHEINSRTVLNLALDIINQGEAKWIP